MMIWQQLWWRYEDNDDDEKLAMRTEVNLFFLIGVFNWRGHWHRVKTDHLVTLQTLNWIELKGFYFWKRKMRPPLGDPLKHSFLLPQFFFFFKN